MSNDKVSQLLNRDEVARPKLTHQQLCERAASWLRGAQRCDPVLFGIASAAEIPDAIGWGSDGSVAALTNPEISVMTDYSKVDTEQAWEYLQSKSVPNLDIERPGMDKVTLVELLAEFATGVLIGGDYDENNSDGL